MQCSSVYLAGNGLVESVRCSKAAGRTASRHGTRSPLACDSVALSAWMFQKIQQHRTSQLIGRTSHWVGLCSGTLLFSTTWLERSAKCGLQGGCLRISRHDWWAAEDGGLNVSRLFSTALPKPTAELMQSVPRRSKVDLECLYEAVRNRIPSSQDHSHPTHPLRVTIRSSLTRRIAPLPAPSPKI